MERNSTAALLLLVLAATGVEGQSKKLVQGQPIEATLGPKESHEYEMTSGGNEAFNVLVEQRGVDLVVTVFDSKGEELLQADGASDEQGKAGTERAVVRALQPGAYRIRVSAFDRPDASPGKYVLSVTGLRPLTAEEIANAQSEQEIKAIEARWEKAVDDADIGTIAAVLRPDGYSMGPNASQTLPHDQVVAQWENTAKQRAKLGVKQTHTISEYALRVMGDTAVSTGRFIINSVTGGNLNQPAKLSGQFVHVWARNKEGWKLVSDYTVVPFGQVERLQPASLKIPPDTLAAYAGTYSLAHSPTRIAISVDNQALVGEFQSDSQPPFKFPMPAVSETSFIGVNGTEMVFVRAPNGQVQELLLLGDGPAEKAIKRK